MMSKMLEIKSANPRKFQVLFLRNDPCEEVVVHEVKQVDFLTVKEHLEHGESVFITSKGSEKLKPPKHKAYRGVKTRLVTAFKFDQL
jgi:hypothetical protein